MTSGPINGGVRTGASRSDVRFCGPRELSGAVKWRGHGIDPLWPAMAAPCPLLHNPRGKISERVWITTRLYFVWASEVWWPTSGWEPYKYLSLCLRNNKHGNVRQSFVGIGMTFFWPPLSGNIYGKVFTGKCSPQSVDEFEMKLIKVRMTARCHARVDRC